MNTRIVNGVKYYNKNNAGYQLKKTEVLTTYINEFQSINDLTQWLKETPVNSNFTYFRSSQRTSMKSWSGTDSYEEAENMLINGWSEMANKLNGMLKSNSMFKPLQKSFNSFDVVGSQASVPRYLQGIPTNMVNRKNKPAPQKVVNIYKSIAYDCSVSAHRIETESLKALQIVNKLESQNIRVNLFVVTSSKEENDRCITSVICIKRSNEKLNVSKLAFPLVHTSMLRRICFNILETDPNTTHNFKNGYGYPTFDNDLRELIKSQYKDVVFIPAIVHTDIEDINTMKDLEYLK